MRGGGRRTNENGAGFKRSRNNISRGKLRRGGNTRGLEFENWGVDPGDFLATTGQLPTAVIDGDY